MRDADNTWINLKAHFRTADKARRELNHKCTDIVSRLGK
jgi:hypothetical protein